MKKFLIVMMFFSTIAFSKELAFKLKFDGKIYELSENKPAEITYKYKSDPPVKFTLKVINTGLDKNYYIIQYEDEKNKKFQTKFSKSSSFYQEGNFNFTYTYNNKKITTIKVGIVKKDNSFQLMSAVFDDNIDFLASTIRSLDNRKSNTFKLNKNYSIWSNYSITYLNKNFLGLKKFIFIQNKGFEFAKHDKPNKIYKKQSVIQQFSMGIDKISKDNSLNGAYLTFGLENTKNFRPNYFDNNTFTVTYDKNSFHTADTVATMFGVGVNRTQNFSNGIYYDTLAQISTFNRKMKSHDGQYANSRSYAISTSFETGIKCNVTPNFSITPQVQQVYHYYNQKNFVDSNNITMPRQTKHVLNTRLGIKSKYKNFYANVNTYLDYYKKLNTVDIEGELGYQGKLKNNININSNVSFRKEIYSKEKFNDNYNNYSIKLNLGIIY